MDWGKLISTRLSKIIFLKMSMTFDHKVYI